jgi:hypothetical protein
MKSRSWRKIQVNSKAKSLAHQKETLILYSDQALRTWKILNDDLVTGTLGGAVEETGNIVRKETGRREVET